MNYLFRRKKLGNTSCKAIAAFAAQPFSIVRNDNIPANMPNYVFRWGCTSTLPTKGTVVNNAEAIHKTSDKRNARMSMQAAGISVPLSFTARHSARLPCVVRPQYHHQGRHLYLCTTSPELDRAVAACGDGWYGASYIKKTREYRIYIVQGRVAAVAEKIPEDKNAVGWNHALGATFQNIRWDDWPMAGCLEAIRAHDHLGLDFSGIDVMEDAEGHIYILEGNAAPSLTSEYRQKMFAKCFDYIVQHGKEGMNHAKKRYVDVIHPAICEKARNV